MLTTGRTAICLVEMSKYEWKPREILVSLGLPSALLRWEIWMKIQRNTYEPSPKLGEDFVPNWGKIEKRQLRLENQTKTRLSSSQELVFVCGYPLMCPTPVVSLHFLREIWLKSQFDRFRGFVLPTHFQEQVGWGNWLGGVVLEGVYF